MAVRLTPGVSKFEGNDKDKTVTLTYDPALVTEEDLGNALAQIGYPPQL